MMMPLSDEVVDRIIEAVGRQHVPDSLDPAHLRDVLDQSFFRYQIRVGRTTKATARKRIEKAKKIAEHADKLITLIEADGDDLLPLDLTRIYESDELYAGALDVPPPLHIDAPDAPALRELTAGLRAVRAAAGQIVADGIPEREESARKTLVARDLADVYEKHFKRPAGRSRRYDGGPAGGPYVRFVEAVVTEFDIPIANETISDYLKQGRP